MNFIGSQLENRKVRNLKQVIITILLGLMGLLIIQWLTAKIWGADGYLHIRMAEMIKHQGLLKKLPQAKYSYFSDKFSDKDWLYHVFLIPFTLKGNIFMGAKWAAWLAGASLYTSLIVIASYYVSSAGLILVGLAPFLSSHFLLTLSRPRPMVLGITLGLWTVHFFLQKKTKKVFLTSLVYSMTHITAILVIGYGIIISFYQWLFSKQIKLKLLGATILGVSLGFIFHPNFPNNLFYFYLNGILVPLFATKWGVLELGAEFFPLTTLEYLKNYPVIILGMLLMSLIVLVERPKVKQETQIWFILASLFVVMGMMSQRYIAHGYPFMILALGAFVTNWHEDENFQLFLKKIEKGVNLLILTGMILVLFLMGSSFKQIVKTAKGTTVMNGHYETMGNWLLKNVPKDELIFHANWSDSQYFIGINPKNDYFVTLDPVYMWHKDKQVYKLYRAVAFGQVKDPYKILKEVFKVNYGYADKRYFGNLVAQVKKDKRFKIVKEDQMGAIFKLRGSND